MIEKQNKKCPYCKTEMEDYKTHPLRIGGKGGEWAFILGNIAEIEEEPLPVHIFVCPKCGKIELFAENQTIKVLLSRRGLKKCTECGQNIPLASEECPYCQTKQKST